MEASSTAVNAPHPDDAADDAAAFFGEPEPEAAVEEERPGVETLPEFAGENGEAAQAEPAPASEAVDPSPQAESAGPTDEGELSEEERAKLDNALEGSGEQQQGKKRGPVEREYIVFQHIALNEATLEALLKQAKAGATPRVAYFELHRSQARNVKGALAAAWNMHKGALGGNRTTMAAVSAGSFAEHTVEERPVTETQLKIS